MSFNMNHSQMISPGSDVANLFSVKGLVALVTGGGTGNLFSSTPH